ncbi:hypothetical protein [Christiangramia aestuarii]|uniref:hypothetical protein n=1 Tax=Christiangramia aestuarii TaxID=1028746 RepID=UPI0012E11B6E|nr:hypothetical protein [Christiangramia aestuarii]
MSSLVNFVISFMMGLLFGHQLEEPKNANYEFQQDTTKLIIELEMRQQVLES